MSLLFFFLSHFSTKKNLGRMLVLASFCVWTKSLICKDDANMGSTVQSEVRRISKFPVSRPDDVSSRPDAHLPTAPSVQTMCHPVRTPDNPASSIRTTCFFRPDTSLYREASVLACSVRTFQQHIRTPISSRMVKILSKFQEREDQSTVRTMWYTVRMRISVRQESQFKMNRPDI
jgi:hypothetical protein